MPVDFSDLSALIVEDNALMRDILRSMLEGLGAETIYDAAEGLTGLTALRRTAAGLVLLDWAMPGLDGIEFLRAVRQKGEGRAATSIVMLTAFAEPAKLDQAYAAGADEVLSKPFSARALHAAIERSILARRPFVTRGDYFGPEMPGVAAAETVVETAS